GRVDLFLIFGTLQGSSRVSACIELDSEAGWGDGPGARGPLDESGTVVYRFRWVWLGQVCDGDLAADAGLLLCVVSEGGLAGDRLLSVNRRWSKGGAGEGCECVELCEMRTSHHLICGFVV